MQHWQAEVYDSVVGVEYSFATGLHAVCRYGDIASPTIKPSLAVPTR